MKSYNLKMNLQLFADPSASLQNTTGTMTNEMKTFYEKRLIDQAEPRLVHDQFATCTSTAAGLRSPMCCR